MLRKQDIYIYRENVKDVAVVQEKFSSSISPSSPLVLKLRLIPDDPSVRFRFWRLRRPAVVVVPNYLLAEYSDDSLTTIRAHL